jgi:hypothetical protein
MRQRTLDQSALRVCISGQMVLNPLAQISMIYHLMLSHAEEIYAPNI